MRALQLAVGFGGQPLRVWAVNKSNACLPFKMSSFAILQHLICLPKDSLSGSGFNQSCFTSAFLFAAPSLALASSSILNYLGTEDEVWWHLPLLALGLGALGVCGGLVFSWNRSRKAKKIEQMIERILEEVYMELWDALPRRDCHQFRGSSFLMFSGYLRLIKYGCVALSLSLYAQV